MLNKEQEKELEKRIHLFVCKFAAKMWDASKDKATERSYDIQKWAEQFISNFLKAQREELSNKAFEEFIKDDKQIKKLFKAQRENMIKNRKEKCIEWKGRITDRGYGVVMIKGKNLLVHRLAYILHTGKFLPDKRSKMTIDHLCRNKICINPYHLEFVSIKENLLRGSGIAVLNSRKIHCKRGHKFDKKNTMIVKSGRMCRKCNVANSRRHRLSKALKDNE